VTVVIPSARGDRRDAAPQAGVERAATVVHDLNNLLAVIQGHVEMLLDEVGDVSPLRGDLDAIRRAAQRASSLVGHLPAVNDHGD
jgi:signal transduction histidine kinase